MMPNALPPQFIAQPCPPLPPAPLLAVKFVAPNGVRVTTSPGSGESKLFPAPATFGFRPGYVYRVELSGLPNRPGETLYPEIEVRGSLAPRPGMNYMEYPAAINFSDLDLAKAAAGSLITKVVYLEDPTKAVPIKATADRPLEQLANVEEDAIRGAADSGRIVMIVRLGNRKPTEAELQKTVVSGTILGPGEMSLGRPAVPPPLAWSGIPLYDPISGPKPFTEECLTDGGDTRNRLGIRDSGKLGGLDATDVALEYTTGEKRKVATSNQVCICVPRFAVQRVELNPSGLYFAYRLEAGIQKMASNSGRPRIADSPDAASGPTKRGTAPGAHRGEGGLHGGRHTSREIVGRSGRDCQLPERDDRHEIRGADERCQNRRRGHVHDQIQKRYRESGLGFGAKRQPFATPRIRSRLGSIGLAHECLHGAEFRRFGRREVRDSRYITTRPRRHGEVQG
jgi:hypothetical protein